MKEKNRKMKKGRKGKKKREKNKLLLSSFWLH